MSSFIFVEEEFEETIKEELFQMGVSRVQPTELLSREKKKTKEKERKKGARVPKTTLELLPFRSVYNHQCFITKSGGFVELFQIESKNIYSLNDQEIDQHVYEFLIFQRQYLLDYKMISMNFPVNTSEQQIYLQHVLKRTTEPNACYFIEQELDRQIYMEKNRVNKEYYLMMFAKDENELADLHRQAKNYQSHFSLKSLSLEKKKKILYKMANMNSKI